MKNKSFLKEWCTLSKEAKTVIVTDDTCRLVAEAVENDIGSNCEIMTFTQSPELMEKLGALSENDLVIVILSLDTYIKSGANEIFSPFGNPADICAKYIFVRLDISKESLFQGLSTPKDMAYSKIHEMSQFPAGGMLHVRNASGTDISLKIASFVTCSHEITAACNYAFLPPSETSADVIPGTANGKILVDVTIGQLYYYGELLGGFGLVDSPIEITVQDGYVVDISGSDMAVELKEKLFRLSKECRELVELGQGLSKMSPTGLIGVDESIINTCHFGIGDGGKCGMHLDVVISEPVIQNGNG